MLINKGEIGVVEQEFLSAREVLVFFHELNVRARIPESYLESAPGPPWGDLTGGGGLISGGGGMMSGSST
jgi:hypothetical protein